MNLKNIVAFLIVGLISPIMIVVFIPSSHEFNVTQMSSNSPEDERNFNIDPRKVMLPDTANRGFSDRGYEIFHGKNELGIDYSKEFTPGETEAIFDWYRSYRKIFTEKDRRKANEDFFNYNMVMSYCTRKAPPVSPEFKDGFAEPNPNIPTNKMELCTKRFYQLVKKYKCRPILPLEEFCQGIEGEYEFKW